MEIFKKSKESICNGCNNVMEVCNVKTMKACGTDKKLRVAFVESCSHYNKPFVFSDSSESTTVSVNHSVDSRVEMMGGGHVEQ